MRYDPPTTPLASTFAHQLRLRSGDVARHEKNLPDAQRSTGLARPPHQADPADLAGTPNGSAEAALPSDPAARLRAVSAERDALLVQNALLRASNEKLVLAMLDAQALREQAEASNQRQNEFLAMLAHELRNPLAPISMSAAMLARIPSLPPKLLSAQKIIERQVQHLSRLLDDLLDAARISSGKITLLRSAIRLADPLASAIEAVQLRLEERGQRLELHVALEDILVDGDAVRLAQVLSNLLVNASKFTQDGGTIVLSSWLAGESVFITVADNGVGMAPDVIPSIFSLFSQGPRSLARSEGGLGVGLNVVLNVVEMHGGTVEASSPGLGQGSVFTLTLPLLGIAARAPAAAAAPQQPRTPGHSQRILLVEDNLDANETLSMFLRSEGHIVVSAFDGPSGLASARSDAFDVLICDIGLPGMNGYDLIRSLHATGAGHVPFAIALSGYGQAEDQARAIAAGFEQYLVKPVEGDTMLNLIASHTLSRPAWVM